MKPASKQQTKEGRMEKPKKKGEKNRKTTRERKGEVEDGEQLHTSSSELTKDSGKSHKDDLSQGEISFSL